MKNKMILVVLLLIVFVFLVSGCTSPFKKTTGEVGQKLIGACEADWQCSAWSECHTSGTQTRDCADLNNCSTTEPMYTIQDCNMSVNEIKHQAKTVAYDGLFGKHEVFPGDIVYFRGRITYVDSSGDFKMATNIPESTDVIYVRNPRGMQLETYHVIDYKNEQLIKENNIIDLWGEARGFYGPSKIAIPIIIALYFE